MHKKNKIVAIILALFLGGLGIHKFYLGKIGQGILYLLFCWTGIPSLIAFIEAILYATMSDAEFEQKYHQLNITFLKASHYLRNFYRKIPRFREVF